MSMTGTTSITRSRSGSSDRNRIGVNLASMIDVVFLLLIYFMVATDFRRGEDVFRMDLPERTGGLNAELYEESEDPLIVLMQADSGSATGIRHSIEGDWPEIDGPDELADFLLKHRVGGSGIASEAYFSRDHPIIILADRDIPWSGVVAAFNAAVRSGYDAVSLEVQP